MLEEVRDTVRDGNADLAAQAGANSREDFVRHRNALLIGAAMDVTVDREKQAPLLKALLDDEDFRARASELVMGSIYEGLREGPNLRSRCRGSSRSRLDRLPMIRNPGSVSRRDRIRRIDRRLEHGDQLIIEVKDAIRDFRKELREQHELNRREHELNRASAERLDAKHARTQKEVEQEMRNSRTVTREVIAEMRELREESRRHFEASHGALVDLAAEIRGWGGGAAGAN